VNTSISQIPTNNPSTINGVFLGVASIFLFGAIIAVFIIAKRKQPAIIEQDTSPRGLLPTIPKVQTVSRREVIKPAMQIEIPQSTIRSSSRTVQPHTILPQVDATRERLERLKQMMKKKDAE
jgi:hypothetical protein